MAELSPLQTFMKQWTDAVDVARSGKQDFLCPVHYLPGRVPSKLVGRKGTRRNWKRSHPPRILYVDLSSLYYPGLELLKAYVSEPIDETKDYSWTISFADPARDELIISPGAERNTDDVST